MKQNNESECNVLERSVLGRKEPSMWEDLLQRARSIEVDSDKYSLILDIVHELSYDLMKAYIDLTRRGVDTNWVKVALHSADRLKALLDNLGGAGCAETKESKDADTESKDRPKPGGIPGSDPLHS